MRETRAAQLRCKPGDLAIVTRCGVPERIGLLVQVVERCRDGLHDWIAELQGPGVFARGAETGCVMLRRRALMNDWNLTPITGMDLPNEMARLDREASEASRRTSAPVHQPCLP